MYKKRDLQKEAMLELSTGSNHRRLRRQRYWDTPFAINPKHSLAMKDVLNDLEKSHTDNELLTHQVIRAKADLENYRKRVQREREEAIQRANENLVLDLLNVLDNFERGLQSGKDLEGPAKNFLDGMEMSFNELLRVLGSYGLEVITAEGKSFDPYYHEAVGISHIPDVPDNQITDVFRRGYKFQGKVIRPAMVIVNKKQ